MGDRARRVIGLSFKNKVAERGPGEPISDHPGYRAYLNPHTGSGPSYGDIIYDRSISFADG